MNPKRLAASQQALYEAVIRMAGAYGEGQKHHGRLVPTWSDEYQAVIEAAVAVQEANT